MAKSKRVGVHGTDAETGRAPKNVCAIDKARFLDKATPVEIAINGSKVYAEPREFASGSFGFYFGDKVTLLIDGVAVKFQVGMNLIAVNSAPKKDSAAE